MRDYNFRNFVIDRLVGQNFFTLGYTSMRSSKQLLLTVATLFCCFICAGKIFAAGSLTVTVKGNSESLSDAQILIEKFTEGGDMRSEVLSKAISRPIRNMRTPLSGSHTFIELEAGKYRVTAQKFGWKRIGTVAEVLNGQTTSITIELPSDEKRMEEVTVFGAARREQKITEAPAAISVVTPEELKKAGSHGQVGKALEGLQGVDVAQSGMNDFSINTRGFNNSINRRMLVLIDGRDPSTPLLNLVEWNSFQNDMADIKSIEVVRGPGSALYGSNAYNGVINITTFSPRDVLGTRVSVTGGEYETFRVNGRHAMVVNDNITLKVNAGYSTQRQSWVRSRDVANGGSLEYIGLAPDLTDLPAGPPGTYRSGMSNRILNMDSLINAHKNAYNYFGTARLDYNLSDNERVLAELGYSHYGNEYFVNQTGRILIPDVEKPFARLAYNSPRFNVQGHWYRRNTPIPQIVMNARATSAERSDVYVVDAQWNDNLLDDKLKVILGASHEYQHVNTSIIGALPLLSPDNLHNNFSGVYGQAEYSLLDNLQIVGALRYDRSTFFEDQISPKAALVYTPVSGHTIRGTVNRSFLRPSYGDLNRRSPAGGAFNYARIDSLVNALTGVNKLGITSAPQWNLGNPNIKPEVSMSYEFGYKGIITKELFITLDAYYNRRSNFISNPLGGLAPDVYTPITYGNAVADSIMRAQLAKGDASVGRAPIDPSRFAIDPVTGKPAMIITTQNIGLVNEYGFELGANYYLNEQVLLNANYAWLGTDVVENKVSANKILPNTSPHRITLGASYTEQDYDFGLQFRYVEKFQWVAGLFEGTVPAYAVLNFNAGCNFKELIGQNMRLGVNVFNALDRRHYQIFGGTILQRYATVTLSYEF